MEKLKEPIVELKKDYLIKISKSITNSNFYIKCFKDTNKIIELTTDKYPLDDQSIKNKFANELVNYSIFDNREIAKKELSKSYIELRPLLDDWLEADKKIIEEFKQSQIKNYKKYTLGELIAIINKWLFIENELDIQIILACALDRTWGGEGIWLFVVAPPSNTKTEIIRSLEDGDKFYQLSTLTQNSLISGYIKNDGTKVQDLASQLNNKILIIKDFTSILSMSKDKRDEIIGQLRDAYDGYLSRKLGNVDEKIQYQTKFGLIAGVTPVIDKYYTIMGSLGERFLKLRFDYKEDEMLSKAQDNEGKEDLMRKEITEAVMGFLMNLEIKKDITFTEEDIDFMKSISKWVSKMRTPVSSRWEGDEFVLDIKPQSEKPTRLFKQFKKLAYLLCNIRQEFYLSDNIKEALIRIALDTSPQDRLIVWDYLIKNNSSDEPTMIKRLRIPRTTLIRILESMYRLEILNNNSITIGDNTFKNWHIEKDFLEKNKYIHSGYSVGQVIPLKSHTLPIKKCLKCDLELVNGLCPMCDKENSNE